MIKQRNTPPAAEFPSALEQIANSLTPETVNGGMAVGPSNGYDSFLGIGDRLNEWNQQRLENKENRINSFKDWNERRLDRKEERRENRDERRDNRQYRKNLRTEGKYLVRDAKANAINEGNWERTDWESAAGAIVGRVADVYETAAGSMGGIGGAIGGLNGEMNAPLGTDPFNPAGTYTPSRAEGESSNSNYIIIGAIVLVVAIAALIFFAKRK